MERKIGEIFEFGGEWYQCVVAIDGCRECSFRAQDYCTRHSECFSDVRSDGISVIFKKLEKVGEPYRLWLSPFNSIMVQRYRLYGRNVIMPDEPFMYFNAIDNTIEIEFKQNKENMEENKLNLKPFDIQKAREGKPVCTRDGRKARIICFDAKDTQPIIGLYEKNIDGIVREYLCSYHTDGRMYDDQNTGYDLMMSPEKKEGWVNVYKGIDGITFSRHPHISKEKAIEEAVSLPGRIDTVKVFWEE